MHLPWPMHWHMPWRDRRGRFIPLKAAVLALCCTPGLIYAILWIAGELGSRSLNEAIHGIGLWTARFLVVGLAVTPAARIFDWPSLLSIRRMVGLAALAYGIAHLLLYLVDQKFHLLTVVAEILKRLYLTIGFVALLGAIALGATSTNAMMRRMGRWWKRLHRLAYPIAALALLHYFMQSKADASQAVFLAGLLLWLQMWRVVPGNWRRSVAIYPVLAVLAAVATLGVEFAWYGVATKIDPWRVLATNGSIDFGLRPAHWVFVAGMAVPLAILARRAAGPRIGIPPSSGPMRAGTANGF